MRKPDLRYEFAQRWFERGSAEGNPFDAFFYLWIALIIAARHAMQREPEDADLKTIKDYFKLHMGDILRVVSAEDERMKQLRVRRGTEGGNIVEAYGHQKVRRRQLFYEYAVAYDDLPNSKKVETLAEIINQVRNNLFHGRKVYDDVKDRELLELVNPLLRSILVGVEGFK
jgi:hypothetical protein